jgi:hypothetical protein
MTVHTFALTASDGRLAAVAVLAIDARYCSVLPIGGNRIIRRFGPIAHWREAELEIAAGLTADPLPREAALWRLITGVEESRLTVRRAMSRDVEIAAR